ncbi:sugar kinase [Natrinema thermotolerans]|uniref:Sugar kinase n=1 Tax=Natrinema thermotolerans TaxID=121872 RepID=A0AAF0PFK8_9EURY|nr:sugar kinase [Natrinema thermotolerans]QCC57497.1 sugar kinase [Natrinema thermotolerans]WMT08574.1 sugar kinase [Natrinema thermotolerans]
MSHDVLIAGETLIDFVPERAGSLEDVAGFERRPGGAPANVAVALARLEELPLFWTRVGADPFGRYLERTLADHGIPDRFVERDSGAKTTLAFVTHDETGDREFTFYRDGTADTRLEPGRVDDATLSDCEWVHAGGVTLSSGSAREATLDLLERAAAADCTVSFDTNLRSELWPDEGAFASVVGDALAHVDVCLATVSELEALGYEGESATALARAAVEEGPVHTAFVTRGSEGAVAVASADAPWPAATVEHLGFAVDVVDTTGAGDAFVAGAIAALRDGDDLEAAVAFANAVGARATTAAGGMTALPTRAEVAALLEAE